MEYLVIILVIIREIKEVLKPLWGCASLWAPNNMGNVG
jgi:hypothetical protein